MGRLPREESTQLGGGLFGKRGGERIREGLFRRRRDHDGPWGRGLFGRRKRGENTKMNKRTFCVR